MNNFQYLKMTRLAEISQGRIDVLKLFTGATFIDVLLPYLLSYPIYGNFIFAEYVVGAVFKLSILLFFFFHVWKGRRWARLTVGCYLVLCAIAICILFITNKSIVQKPLFLSLAVFYTAFCFFAGSALLTAKNMRLFFDAQRSALNIKGQIEESPQFKFDIAISFAGQDRLIAEALSDLLTDRGLRVFYDQTEQSNLLGKNLFTYLQSVYRDNAQFCIVLISKHYVNRAWTLHEWEQIQERVLRGRPFNHLEYILPIRLDDTELPGLNSLTGFLDFRKLSTKSMADVIYQKFLSIS